MKTPSEVIRSALKKWMCKVEILFVVTVLLGAIVLGVVIFNIFKKKNISKIETKIKTVSKENSLLAIDDLRRLLKTKPNDYKAREKLVDLLFSLKMYLPAVKECLILIDASAASKDIDELKYTLRVGEAYFYLKNLSDAKKYFLLGKRLDDLNFTANLFLGKIEYESENYDKALIFLNVASKVEPDNLESLRLKGVLSFQSNLHRDCVNSLYKVIEKNPKDNEALFYLGFSLFKLNRYDDAKKTLGMVDDPRYAVDIQFVIANIHIKEKSYVQAIEIFEKIIEKRDTVKINPNRLVEIYYQLSECYYGIHNIGKSLAALEQAALINPNYKDVQTKIEIYSQLHKNTLLEKYLIGSVNEFTNICKMFVKYFINKNSTMKGNVKFLSTQMNARGEMEIRAEISSNKFTAVYYFIFFRSTTTVGELIIRNIYNMLKDEKIDKGICVTAGNFSESAISFIESRMLEIIEKKGLSEILNSISILLQNNKPLE